jgi:hypothetical protein
LFTPYWTKESALMQHCLGSGTVIKTMWVKEVDHDNGKMETNAGNNAMESFQGT